MSPELQESRLNWIIFTDGASSGNPGPGGWGAILASPQGEVIEIGGREVPTTNNRMELTAAIRALEKLHLVGKSPVDVYTDSTYVIRGVTQWIWGWKKRGWITAEGKPVANADLWQKLSGLSYQRPIQWKYVRGHQGTPGNERADEIAVLFSKGVSPHLYQGALLKYSIPIYDVPENTDLPDLQSREKSAKPQKAYSYLSCVGNLLQRHSTWAECERRVKGQSGAKFKKAMNPEEEAAIVRAWGFRADDVK